MKHRFSFALALVVFPSTVFAAPKAKPKTDLDVVTMFARLPASSFRYFGSYNNLSTNLLDGKGVIVDRAKNYIEIPYEGRSNHPDREHVYMWQMTAFRDKNKKQVVVVNSSIYSQSKVKPFLHVYRVDKNGFLYRTTARDFPFKRDFETSNGKRIPYTYSLPRTGNTITSGLPETDASGYSFRWTGSRFVRFIPKDIGHGG